MRARSDYHTGVNALPSGRWFRDGLTTVLVVVLGFFAIGRIGGSIPYGWTASLISGGLYVALLALYGLYAGPGRRSGAGPFLIGGVLLLPVLILWFFLELVEHDHRARS